MSSGQEVLDRLLGGDPADTMNWLTRVRSGETVVPADFNWHLLAQAAAANALRAVYRAEALLWARIAITTYEDLLQQATTVERRFSLLPPLMHLRAQMVAEYNPEVGDMVLDPDYLVKCFQENAPLSYEDAAQAVSSPGPQSRSMILDLRRLKNILAPFIVLTESRSVQLSPWLYDWLTLYNDLP